MGDSTPKDTVTLTVKTLQTGMNKNGDEFHEYSACCIRKALGVEHVDKPAPQFNGYDTPMVSKIIKDLLYLEILERVSEEVYRRRLGLKSPSSR